MSIEVECRCGASIVVGEEDDGPEDLEGLEVTCPECGEQLTVDLMVDDEDEDVLAGSGGTTEVVLDVFSNLPEREGFYVAPDIPDGKLAGAQSGCGIEDDEEIFAIVDCTVFASAKNCIAFTPELVYYHNDWSGEASGPGSVEYGEFAEADLYVKHGYHVHLGTGEDGTEHLVEVSGCSVSPEDLVSILYLLQCALNGDDADLDALTNLQGTRGMFALKGDRDSSLSADDVEAAEGVMCERCGSTNVVMRDRSLLKRAAGDFVSQFVGAALAGVVGLPVGIGQDFGGGPASGAEKSHVCRDCGNTWQAW